MKRSFEINENQVTPEFLPPAVTLDGRLLIDLAGTMVEVRSESGYWLAQARARYGSFAGDCGGGRPARRGSAMHGTGGTPVPTTGRGSAAAMIVHHIDEAAMVATHGYLSKIDEDGRSAEIASAEGTDILDGVLRMMMPRGIAPDLLVHCALLADGDRGFLCCGVSGSGKSTMAALFPDNAVCDELARVHAGPGGVEVRSLPFWKARPWTGTLAAIFFIEHGADNRRMPLGVTEAVQSLRRHVYWPVEHSALMGESFETLTDVCGNTPIFRLAFRPEVSVWATMTEAL